MKSDKMSNGMKKKIYKEKNCEDCRHAKTASNSNKKKFVRCDNYKSHIRRTSNACSNFIK